MVMGTLHATNLALRFHKPYAFDIDDFRKPV